MWNRKEIKKKSKKSLKKNYWNKIFVCLMSLFLIGNYNITRDSLNNGKNLIENFFPTITNINIIKDTNTTNGTFKLVFDGTSKIISTTQSYLGNIEKSIYKITNHKAISEFLLEISAVLIGLLFKIFVLNVISVGENRFFLENRNYKKTRFTRLFTNFKKGKYLKTVKTIFLKNFYLVLWCFTIIGPFIKLYSYRMVKFIVAENPNINSKDAIKLSCKMMQGNKWKMFILDISYFGYFILDYLLFGIIGILFLNPYMKTAETEIYVKLKDNINSKEINDANLYLEKKSDYYPGTKKEERVIDYYRKYNIYSFILFFFSFSIAGWLWEVLLYIIKDGNFVNRGTMYGPWLPIYGTGCVIVLLLLIPKKLKKITDNPILTFLIIMLICAIIEYFSGWACEYFKCARYWDYSGYFLNIKGRICLECTMFFGIGGTACIYLIAPKLDRFFKKLSLKSTFIICISLISVFCIDWIYSSHHPRMGAGITDDNEMMNTQIHSKYCKK